MTAKPLHSISTTTAKPLHSSHASNMMQHSNVSDGNDLEFSTSVDGSIKQNVPIPPPTNGVLEMMRNSQTNQSTSGPMQPQPQPAVPSYTPSYGGLSFLNQSSHPTACLFHILFKGLAFVAYILGSKFTEDVMVTVICILLSAADFWVVKNITGRLLVGLRWWNKVDPSTGLTSWIYESAAPTSEHGSNQNSFDSKFFWFILYITPALWVFFCVTAILWLKFQCFVTLATALVLSGSNVSVILIVLSLSFYSPPIQVIVETLGVWVLQMQR